MKRPYLKRLGKIGKYKVYLVSGLWVRRHWDVDFTQGGNPERYAFIPENEIWVDNDLSKDERKYLVLHEFDEVNRMAKGIPYEDAHDGANIIEREVRAGGSL